MIPDIINWLFWFSSTPAGKGLKLRAALSWDCSAEFLAYHPIQANSHIFRRTQKGFNLIYPWEGGGNLTPPYIYLLFFCSNTKCFEARKLKFSDISHLHMPIPKAKSWAFKPTTWVLTFTFTKLNLYLDLPPVIGFKHFIVLWKAYNNSNQIAQFL